MIEKLKVGQHKFAVLGFPCNQFAHQEPAKNATELYNGMAWVRPGMQRGYNFVPFFPLTVKLKVNGAKEDPIFTHLKYVCPPPWQTFAPSQKITYEPKFGTDIRWNFEKFLIGPDGEPFRRYSSKSEPHNIENDIRFLLGEDGYKPREDGNSIDFHKKLNEEKLQDLKKKTPREF